MTLNLILKKEAKLLNHSIFVCFESDRMFTQNVQSHSKFFV